MGRSKIKPELIKNERLRSATFHRRKKSLIKKTHELSTLCNVQIGMIIYGPPNAAAKHDPEIWPPNNDDEIKKQIKLYKKQDPCLLGRRTVDASHYFIERQKKAENELRKLRLHNMAAKYPTWDHSLDHLSETQLRMFADKLDAKIQAVSAAMNLIRPTNMLAPRTRVTDNALICTTNYHHPNSIDPPLMMNLDGSSSCYQQEVSDSQFRERFFGRSSVQLEELNGLQQVHQLKSRDDLSGNHGAYMPTSWPIYYYPVMAENMMNNVNPMSTLPMPLSGVPMLPMPMGYFPAPIPPLQPQYTPNLLAGFDGSSGVPDSQINGWYHLDNFQMNQ